MLRAGVLIWKPDVRDSCAMHGESPRTGTSCALDRGHERRPNALRMRSQAEGVIRHQRDCHSLRSSTFVVKLNRRAVAADRPPRECQRSALRAAAVSARRHDGRVVAYIGAALTAASTVACWIA